MINVVFNKNIEDNRLLSCTVFMQGNRLNFTSKKGKKFSVWDP